MDIQIRISFDTFGEYGDSIERKKKHKKMKTKSRTKFYSALN